MKILTVGRIAPVKNLEIIIRAAALLRTQLTIAGEPALPGDKNYLRMLKGLGGDVVFLGKVSFRDLPRLYQSHDVFAHASNTGSLDKALLEAMACGMRVVSCNDAARGFLPAPWMFAPDNAQELAEKILHHQREDFDVRQYVLEHHNLKKLIRRISSLL